MKNDINFKIDSHLFDGKYRVSSQFYSRIIKYLVFVLMQNINSFFFKEEKLLTQNNNLKKWYNDHNGYESINVDISYRIDHTVSVKITGLVTTINFLEIKYNLFFFTQFKSFLSHHGECWPTWQVDKNNK